MVTKKNKSVERKAFLDSKTVGIKSANLKEKILGLLDRVVEGEKAFPYFPFNSLLLLHKNK